MRFIGWVLIGLLGATGGWTQVRDRGALGLPEASPVAPGFEIGYVLPQVHRWYAPRQLLETYMQPWYVVDTRYASDLYSRYVSSLLEGDEFYDLLGNPVGRGWLVYHWSQQQPQTRGSDIVKYPVRDTRTIGSLSYAFSAYDRFFDRLVIARDGDGRSAYRLMVGDEIYTQFTPLTFFKPRFNGVRLDGATERLTSTLLLSRVSEPNGLLDGPLRVGMGQRTNVTQLTGGHAELQTGDQTHLGFTYVNVRNAQMQLDLDDGKLLGGVLTVNQNQPLQKLWVRLRDDSPEDRQGGAVLIAHDIVLVDTSGQQRRGSEIGFLPEIEGGVNRAGAWIADGSESIVLEYDLGALDHDSLKTADLRRVFVELTLADDYRVEMASNLQTEGIGGAQAGVVFLPVMRAAGNVQDRSNARVVRADYSLPVASEILGVDWNLMGWRGLSAQGELALNRQHGLYPNPKIGHHHRTVRQARAGYAQVAYRHSFGTLFFEGFSMEDGYNTTYWLTEDNGVIKYRAPVPEVYELVDDDDDFDAVPEWQRPYQPWNRVAWPGYDENGDFLNDNNQNDNLIPDYEEPFLRFRADRPEFLCGLDMNHNGTIDRFENDDLPDYPYKKDHRGVNGYAQVQVAPGLHLTLGRQQLGLISGDGRTRAWYFLGTWERLLGGGGRVRLFEHGALVRDDIPDDLLSWFQPVDAQGQMEEVEDALPARNTWKNSLYADLEHRVGPGIRLQHRGKWDWLRQRDSRAELASREGRRTGGFLGLIDRAEWSIPVGLATVEPRWKSEYRRDRPFSARLPVAESLEETLFLLWNQPLLAEQVGVVYFPRYGRQVFATELQVGLEASWFWLLEGQRPEVDQDYFRWTGVAQLVNRNAYEGYQLVVRAGLRLSRWDFARDPAQSTSTFFMTANAGLR